MKHRCFSLVLSLALATGLACADESAPTSVPFRIGKQGALLVPVKIADSVETEFMLDTGLGFNLVSPQFAKKLGLEGAPGHKVRPVTGGELDMAQGHIDSLALAGLKESQDVVIGDPRCFVGPNGETQVDGILSLAFFREHPFTIDYPNRKLVLENTASLAQRKAAGSKVECQLGDEAPVASVSLMLKERPPEPEKPGGIAGFLAGFGSGPPEPPKATVQVSTGCESLLLDSKTMFTLNIEATGANITENEQTDQNGVRYRSWTSQMGKVELSDTQGQALAQEKAPVVFRKLLVEGVLGQSFLRRYTVTFNLPGSELIFGRK